MSRWQKFFIMIALGLAAGLVYGWVISPVEYTNTTPDTLRADYRRDYVLMAAEVFNADQNLDQAARRLGILGSEHPARIATQALNYAQQANFPESDLALLQSLATALQTWQPVLHSTYSAGGGSP
ncbi:MAG: hypothetical protein KKC71_00585 [Chloroflexi bacterium]|nr:hypothetical protein [Chloroflexota bacterium]